MITDELRVLAADPRGVEIANLYLHAIEADDVSGLKRLMKPGVTLAHANYPPVRGRDEAVSMIHGYRQIVGGVEFEVHTLFGGEGLIAIEKVNFMASCTISCISL